MIKAEIVNEIARTTGIDCPFLKMVDSFWYVY